MRLFPISTCAIVAVLAAGGLAGGVAAAGPPGHGTFTRITTPHGTTTYQFDGHPGATNHLTVAGTASLDVSSVDIDCLYSTAIGVQPPTPLAANVPVSGGSFSKVITYTNPQVNCRLRAVPTGTVFDHATYLGAYSGPILYTVGLIPNVQANVRYGYAAIAEGGTALTVVGDAGQCGVAAMLTVDTPTMLAHTATGGSACAFALPGENISPSGTPSASSVAVNGHNAYLPYAVNSVLISNQGLTLTQPPLSVAFHPAANGDVTIVESAKLMRCSVSDHYPPTNASCPALVPTGVTFTRTIDVIRGDHQTRLRDIFRSTDGAAHSINLQYQASTAPPPTGAPGYRFPGHGTTFHRGALDQVVTGLGSGAATVLIRSDVFASPDDPGADTTALSWSSAPHALRFSHVSPNQFAMTYALAVPAHGAAYLGFAQSESVTTAPVQRLGVLAEKDMVTAPTITSPHGGATVAGHKTTVRGTLAIGANGRPTSVRVNGHSAKITHDTWSVTFTESKGRHKITATARDSAGNTASRSVTIKNS